MWFNNAVIYRYEANEQFDLSSLSEEKLKPCPPHARFVFGWLPTIADELAHEVAGSALICLGKEERVLPRTVINKFLAERILTIETQQGRTVKRAEKSQIAEDLEFELLPKSFCVQKRLFALFDTQNQRLIINSASANQASNLLSLLRKSLANVHLEPLFHAENLAIRFAEWINHPQSLPAPFKLASDCQLIALDDEKKRVTCKGYDLPAHEVLTLLSQGLVVAELSVIWNERIQFTLTQDLTLKRLKSLEYLMDEFSDIKKMDDHLLQQDASLILLGDELRALINDLIKALHTGQKTTEPTRARGQSANVAASLEPSPL